MKPFLTNHTPTLIETMPSFLQPIAQCLTTKEQAGLVKFSKLILLFNKIKIRNSKYSFFCLKMKLRNIRALEAIKYITFFYGSISQ